MSKGLGLLIPWYTSPVSGVMDRALWTLVYCKNGLNLFPETRRVVILYERVRSGVMNEVYSHTPVLLQECFDILQPALTQFSPDGAGSVYLDATLGLGGHALFFLENLPGLKVIGIDRDYNALSRATARLSFYKDRFFPFHGRFDDVHHVWEVSPWKEEYAIQGILADFGVSSLQLDDPERGFSYAQDGPLDMRMDISQGQTCAELLAVLDKKDIAYILREYGEEKFAYNIAKMIVKEREKTPLRSTTQLVELIYRAIPASQRRKGGHPAKRTFQALRIAVNAELYAIEEFLPEAFGLLSHRGRMACMSFQSLEDKLVKRYFTQQTESRAPHGLPMELPNTMPLAYKVHKKAITASETEINLNPRAASVRLRAIEKI